jgi:hypothetical protein
MLTLPACSTHPITVRESPTVTSGNGHYVVHDPTNKIIQETIIRKNHIVSSWEYMDYTMTTPEYSDAVESGKVKPFTPYWAETVTDGNGIRNLFSLTGKKVGFEDVSNGRIR